MTTYRYLIIGGGMTAAAAADGIREVDATGSIGIISAESDAAYNRPPLSKGLWKGEPLDSIWRPSEDAYDPKGDVFSYEFSGIALPIFSSTTLSVMVTTESKRQPTKETNKT